jgi:5,10-methenyltetrahydromethanopterin hydrogenase
MKKFLERGWRITAGQQLKIMWQISELNLADHNVLREQLTGVDALFMQELINALRDVEPQKLTSTYVAEIIDRIFD